MIGTAVEVWRGSHLESVHRVAVVVSGTDGIVRRSGGVLARVYARSAVKPLQALPLVQDGVADRYGFGAEEIALACASHSGEPQHIAVARRILERIGAGEDLLACGAHAPFHAESARSLRASGGEPGRIHNNCSGKHAGMLALAAGHGWPLEGYHLAEHPVQRRMLEVMAEWCATPVTEIGTAVDGCGVITFRLPLEGLAHAFARLAGAAAAGEAAPHRIVDAMTSHPELVGGTGRMCSDVMRVTGGRVFLKVGAEGVYCAGVPAAGLGIGLKVEDGAKRAAEPALLAVLRELSLLDASELEALHDYAEPEIRNTRAEVVGRVSARVTLEPA